LGSQDVAFLRCADANQEANVDIAVRNQALQSHQALLASVAADTGVLDCLLAYPWAAALGGISRLPAFAGVLAAPVAAAYEPGMAQDVALFLEQIRGRSAELWALLAPLVIAKRGFLRDCAQMAFAVPPSADASATLIQTCLQDEHVSADPQALAALIAFAANAGCGPGADVLTSSISNLQLEMQHEVSNRLQAWRGLVRAQALSPWCALLPTTSGQELLSAEQEPQSPLSSQAPPQPGRSSLRDMMLNPPAEFCCQLDGKLLVDPVRSPIGHVFERSVLAHALEAGGGVCPLTGNPLALAECNRDPHLRGHIVKWVRSNWRR